HGRRLRAPGRRPGSPLACAQWRAWVILLAAIRDPRIAELGRRGQAAAELSVVASEPALPAPAPEQDDHQGAEGAPSSLRLVDPHRACIETNLTRRGFWLAVAGGPRQLALPLDGEDRFGTFTVEAGP